MRIAQIAPLEIRVPPVGYGGTELVISLLTEELVRRGHQVTLFASGDSMTSARLYSVFPHHLRGLDRDKTIWNMLNVVACLEQADNFDIIHNHNDSPEGLALAGLVKTPVITTFHDNLSGDQLALFAAYKGYYNVISKAMIALLPEKEGFVGVIYNAIDCKSYPVGPQRREGYLLFLSRIRREKGAHIAIEVAKRLSRKLIIAGNVYTVDEGYFNNMVLPQVDGDLICYFGEADYHQKRNLLANADCLLAPITWAEPFGLFMAEAMACGTPVIAFNRGAAPEVVLHGKTGFIVADVDDMVEAVGDIHRIDRNFCHQHVRRHFDVPRMADDYLAVYERILEARSIALFAPSLTPSPTRGQDALDLEKLTGIPPRKANISPN